MAKSLDIIFHEYETFCNDSIKKIGVYSRFSSYGSTLMVERLFELLFVHFERLIEDTFISYALGLPNASGVSINRTVTLTSEKDIQNLYSGYKDFPDWTRWDYLILCSELFFDPSPFSQLRSTMVCLQDIKTIRNALSHISGISQYKYESLVRKNLGYFPATGLPVAKFLLMLVPKRKTVVFFRRYINDTIKIAKLICY